ncbi:MAG: hypothetical protein K0S67_1733, partial [Nitrososphaeraceae archaeon]|nr:hypothetical protein [Nitrososphaeraceae archaeon]
QYLSRKQICHLNDESLLLFLLYDNHHLLYRLSWKYIQLKIDCDI